MKKQIQKLCPVTSEPGRSCGLMVLCPICGCYNCYVGFPDPNRAPLRDGKYDLIFLPAHGECGHSFEVVFESGKGTAEFYYQYEVILCDCGKEVLIGGYEAGKTRYEK